METFENAALKDRDEGRLDAFAWALRSTQRELARLKDHEETEARLCWLTSLVADLDEFDDLDEVRARTPYTASDKLYAERLEALIRQAEAYIERESAAYLEQLN